MCIWLTGYARWRQYTRRTSVGNPAGFDDDFVLLEALRCGGPGMRPRFPVQLGTGQWYLLRVRRATCRPRIPSCRPHCESQAYWEYVIIVTGVHFLSTSVSPRRANTCYSITATAYSDIRLL